MVHLLTQLCTVPPIKKPIPHLFSYAFHPFSPFQLLHSISYFGFLLHCHQILLYWIISMEVLSCFNCLSLHHCFPLTPHFTASLHSQASWNDCPNVLFQIPHLRFILQPVQCNFCSHLSAEPTHTKVIGWLASFQIHCTLFSIFLRDFSAAICKVDTNSFKWSSLDF